MGIYNILRAEIECPRCHQIARQQIDLYFGYRSEMLDYNLVDKYRWCLGKAVQNGGRPENGNIDGEEYVLCELCNKDFFVKVIVRNDYIEAVEHDSAKDPYIKD